MSSLKHSSKNSHNNNYGHYNNKQIATEYLSEENLFGPTKQEIKKENIEKTKHNLKVISKGVKFIDNVFRNDQSIKQFQRRLSLDNNQKFNLKQLMKSREIRLLKRKQTQDYEQYENGNIHEKKHILQSSQSSMGYSNMMKRKSKYFHILTKQKKKPSGEYSHLNNKHGQSTVNNSYSSNSPQKRKRQSSILSNNDQNNNLVSKRNSYNSLNETMNSGRLLNQTNSINICNNFSTLQHQQQQINNNKDFSSIGQNQKQKEALLFNNEEDISEELVGLIKQQDMGKQGGKVIRRRSCCCNHCGVLTNKQISDNHYTQFQKQKKRYAYTKLYFLKRYVNKLIKTVKKNEYIKGKQKFHLRQSVVQYGDDSDKKRSQNNTPPKSGFLLKKQLEQIISDSSAQGLTPLQKKQNEILQQYDSKEMNNIVQLLHDFMKKKFKIKVFNHRQNNLNSSKNSNNGQNSGRSTNNNNKERATKSMLQTGVNQSLFASQDNQQQAGKQYGFNKMKTLGDQLKPIVKNNLSKFQQQNKQGQQNQDAKKTSIIFENEFEENMEESQQLLQSLQKNALGITRRYDFSRPQQTQNNDLSFISDTSSMTSSSESEDEIQKQITRQNSPNKLMNESQQDQDNKNEEEKFMRKGVRENSILRAFRKSILLHDNQINQILQDFQQKEVQKSQRALKKQEQELLQKQQLQQIQMESSNFLQVSNSPNNNNNQKNNKNNSNSGRGDLDLQGPTLICDFSPRQNSNNNNKNNNNNINNNNGENSTKNANTKNRTSLQKKKSNISNDSKLKRQVSNVGKSSFVNGNRKSLKMVVPFQSVSPKIKINNSMQQMQKAQTTVLGAGGGQQLKAMRTDGDFDNNNNGDSNMENSDYTSVSGDEIDYDYENSSDRRRREIDQNKSPKKKIKSKFFNGINKQFSILQQFQQKHKNLNNVFQQKGNSSKNIDVDEVQNAIISTLSGFKPQEQQQQTETLVNNTQQQNSVSPQKQSQQSQKNVNLRVKSIIKNNNIPKNKFLIKQEQEITGSILKKEKQLKPKNILNSKQKYMAYDLCNSMYNSFYKSSNNLNSQNNINIHNNQSLYTTTFGSQNNFSMQSEKKQLQLSTSINLTHSKSVQQPQQQNQQSQKSLLSIWNKNSQAITVKAPLDNNQQEQKLVQEEQEQVKPQNKKNQLSMILKRKVSDRNSHQSSTQYLNTQQSDIQSNKNVSFSNIVSPNNKLLESNVSNKNYFFQQQQQKKKQTMIEPKSNNFDGNLFGTQRNTKKFLSTGANFGKNGNKSMINISKDQLIESKHNLMRSYQNLEQNYQQQQWKNSNSKNDNSFIKLPQLKRNISERQRYKNNNNKSFNMTQNIYQV